MKYLSISCIFIISNHNLVNFVFPFWLIVIYHRQKNKNETLARNFNFTTTNTCFTFTISMAPTIYTSVLHILPWFPKSSQILLSLAGAELIVTLSVVPKVSGVRDTCSCFIQDLDYLRVSRLFSCREWRPTLFIDVQIYYITIQWNICNHWFCLKFTRWFLSMMKKKNWNNKW